MDRTEESFQKSMQQFKAKNLVLETHDDGLVQVKHISGRTFASGYMERDKIPGWLEENMDRIIETVKASGLLTPCVHKIEMANGVTLQSKFVEPKNQLRGNSPIPEQEIYLNDSTQKNIRKLALELEALTEEERMILLIESLGFKVTIDKVSELFYGVAITDEKEQVIFAEKLFKTEIVDRLATIYYQIFKNKYSLI